MLHIMWMIIKFLLILIGIILGLVLLTVLLVLFCPFRYHVSAEKAEKDFKKTKLYVSANWLFYGVWVRLFYQQGKINTGIYLLGIPIHKILEKKKIKKQKIAKTEKREELEISDGTEENISVKGLEAEEREEPEFSDKIEKDVFEGELQTEEREELEISNEIEEDIPEKGVKIEEKDNQVELSNEPVDNESQMKTVQSFEKIRNILAGVSLKMKSVGKPGSAAEKIAKKIHSIKEKIDKILDKINWWKNFLNHPKVRASIKCTKNALIRMLKHIIPTRLYGDITFGSTDPAITGAVLAMLGMTMPFHKNCVNVRPIFEDKNVLTGNIQVKGRIYIIVLLFQVLKVVINKNIWYTIKYWKNKEGS